MPEKLLVHTFGEACSRVCSDRPGVFCSRSMFPESRARKSPGVPNPVADEDEPRQVGCRRAHRRGVARQQRGVEMLESAAARAEDAQEQVALERQEAPRAAVCLDELRE